MKKLLALALALVMAVSLGVVAFAAPSIGVRNTLVITDPDDSTAIDSEDSQENDKGKTYWFPLFDEEPPVLVPVTEYDATKNAKAFVVLRDGDDFVKKVSIAKLPDLNQYGIKVETNKPYDTTKESALWDIQLRIGSKVVTELLGYSVEQSWLSESVDAYGRAYLYGFGTTPENNDEYIVDGEPFLAINSYLRLDDNAPVVSAPAGTEYLTIYAGDELPLRFEVKNTGAKSVKYNMYFTETVPEKLVDENPEANLEYIEFLGKPSFKATGEVSFKVPNKNWTAYTYDDGKLVKIAAEYDEDDDVLTFKTKTLGAYVFSDIELVAADTDKTNPETGSVDFVNVAVALGVVSLAAAAAVVLKK